MIGCAVQPPPVVEPGVHHFLDNLRACIGHTFVITNESAMTTYRADPRGRFTGHAMAVVKPANTQQVSDIVKLCNEYNICMVARAGGTGLVGGQTLLTDRPAVIISVERLTHIRACNTQTMTVEAGCILSDIHTAAEERGYEFPLWMASQGSARIGGMLATNAGGLHVLRYGMARDLCYAVEAVMADGTILNTLKRVRKNNTGYDIKNLLIGSEGTLGIITAAVLKLVPRPEVVETAFCAVDTPQEAVALLEYCQQTAGTLLSAFELISAQGFSFFKETGISIPPPCAPDSSWYILIECTGSRIIPVRNILENILSHAMAQSLVTDAVLASTDTQRQNLWAIRENLPEANRRIGSVSSHDIAVPVEQITPFIDQMPERIHRLDASLRLHIFGHVGDGNLHANVFPANGKVRTDYADIFMDIKREVHDLVHELDGAISAEHGIGRIKVDDLERYEDPVKLETMRRIKQVLDPKSLLNPGTIIKD